MHMSPGSRALGAALAIGSTVTLAAQHVEYPETRRVEHVDRYHGVDVPDPYRWLEDDNAPETIEWVKAQNAVTFGYLEKIPFREAVKARVWALNDYEKYSEPLRKGPYIFFRRNAGLQDQSVLYIQRGADGSPEVLIDPNVWGGTVALTTFVPSRDARYAVYGVSKSGSDWQEYRVIELATKRTLPDTVEWVKVSVAAWQRDGFFYSRYPAAGKGEEKAALNENHQVYYHRLGTPQSEDALVHEDRGNPQRFHYLTTTDDERFAVLTVSERGKGKDGNAVFVMDAVRGDRAFVPVVPEITDDTFEVIDNVGDKLLVLTNYKAPNSRVVLIDPRNPAEANWRTVIAEKPEPLQAATSAGEKIFAQYLKDVTTRVNVHRLDGALENELALPGPGVATGFTGERDDTLVFYTFNSLTVPPTIYQYDVRRRVSEIFRQPKVPGYDPSAYETKQVFYSSKDGTRIPMFLVHRKGLALNGSNPTLLYGYGGFNIVLSPTFSASRLALLEQGFVYASANLRGGGEYGETWHKAGMKLNKQNVFDDFVAAAEWLIAAKYTSSDRLAIQGGSNGGLLVGAVMNQRPELFKAAVPQVGVMDMLRFHKFTIGWNWTADFGSSDDPDEFAALKAYSPLHNIRKGVKYPATLITTADHDDRVVPAHSFKYAATLQELAAHETPLLIRIETEAGHGALNALRKTLATVADVYTFLMFNLGVRPVE